MRLLCVVYRGKQNKNTQLRVDDVMTRNVNLESALTETIT